MIANYNGRLQDNNTNVKYFTYSCMENLWKLLSYSSTETVLSPSSNTFDSLFIPGNIYISGSVITVSDINVKNNIKPLNNEVTNKLMNLKPTSFTYINDNKNELHYGFIAQDFEKEYPELVKIKPDDNYQSIKAINYMEIIPLLVDKVQTMQKEIDELKVKLSEK